MPFAANYAFSNYGRMAYGVRAPALYSTTVSESINAADILFALRFHPLNIFDSKLEERIAALLAQMRTAIAEVRLPLQVQNQTRNSATKTDERVITVAPQTRNFKP